MGKAQVAAPKASASTKKDKTKPKKIDKPTIKKSSKSKNQFTEKEVSLSAKQVFKMNDSEVAELKTKANKIEKQEEQNEQVEHEKVKVMRKESVLNSKSKSDEASVLTKNNPLDESKQTKRGDELYWAEHGVIKVKGIPHGFYEEQMRNFFSQFGRVTNLKLCRSHKTGNSKGYAYVQFRYAEVAEIVAETMNNYLMFDCILKVFVLPKERCTARMWWNKIDPELPPLVKKREKKRLWLNSDKPEEVNIKRRERQAEKLKKMEEKLVNCGVDFKIDMS
jgi:nucleolar protein 15